MSPEIKIDPEIPDFLRRESARPARRIASTKRKWKAPKMPFAKAPPKSPKYNGATRVEIVLGDEVSAIGCGYRTVWAKRGRKWVYICDSSGRRGKLSRTAFDKVVRIVGAI
jgi:hypothetical protein